MRYLLDTNICIRFLRQRHSRLVESVRSHSPSQVCVCSVVVAELFHGSERSEHPASNREKILAFLRPIVSFPFDDEAAVAPRAGIVGRREQRQLAVGRRVGDEARRRHDRAGRLHELEALRRLPVVQRRDRVRRRHRRARRGRAGRGRSARSRAL